jgi:hypothetical protein
VWELVYLSLSSLREEHRLRVFEITLLKRILVSMREAVIAGWSKLHAEKHVLVTKYYYSDQIKENIYI